MSSIEQASSPFMDFVRVADMIADTSKRTEKAELLGSYLKALPDDDLAIAARYVAGRVFPLHDQRTINIGTALLTSAVSQLGGATTEHVRQRLVARGDLGDVAGEVLAGRSVPGHPLTLQDIEQAMATIAETNGSKKKEELVTALLEKAAGDEARYLVKLMLGDLRIGMKEGGVEETIARMSDVGIGDVQWAHMLTGDIGRTALLARYIRLGEARMSLFHPIRFMLATPAADDQDLYRQMPERFIVEDKFDGIRAQAHIGLDTGDPTVHGIGHDGVRVALFSRTLDAVTASFPELIAPLASLLSEKSLKAGLILDGEIVPVQGDTIMPFQTLQRRLGRKRLTEEMLRELPVAYVVFDILYCDGNVLLELPLSERRTILNALTLDGMTLRRASAAFMGHGDDIGEAFDAARNRGNEGLMVKDPASSYKPGRRGRDWLKVKRALATLDVVVTAVEVGNGRRRHLLSDFTFAVRASEDDPTLLNIGKAYSGLTDAELEELTAWFQDHTLQQFAHGKVRIVEPQIVIEVAFDRVQPSKRHKSGYALRFPRIVRLRPDKPTTEIDTLATVRSLADEEPEA